MGLEQKRQHWFDADDNEVYASELRTSAAVYIVALENELAALKGQLAVADEMDTALEWLDNGYVIRSTDKLERLDTAQRVYREMRAARAEEGSEK